MQRYPPGALPRNGAIQPSVPPRENDPLRGAQELCMLIRSEHGRAGVARFVAALQPFVPHDFVRQLAGAVGVEAPRGEEPPEKKPQQSPQMKPEQLMKLMNLAGGGNGGGGADPASLLKLFSELNGK